MRHLILVHQKTKQDIEDYREIARRIHARTDDIRVFIADTKDANWQEAEVAYSVPSLTVSPMPFKHFRPRGGTVLVGDEYPKGYQYERMQEMGVPIPEWVRIEPDTVIHPGVIIEGQSVIGAASVVGPFSHLVNAVVGREAELKGWNYIVDTTIPDGSTVDPYVEQSAE